ncbi:hypothetical protein PoB_001812100 [Plakobranchus ocellatus]|uniref:Uncharacterized protein n=1 Tax=Plakobranchus ocellatus TaxID=259542 RepID=A0AAV3ZAD1_9GAST|nr:hypothetical protein PoB_001812100 [Plakobranchus ocellatus]
MVTLSHLVHRVDLEARGRVYSSTWNDLNSRSCDTGGNKHLLCAGAAGSTERSVHSRRSVDSWFGDRVRFGATWCDIFGRFIAHLVRLLTRAMSILFVCVQEYLAFDCIPHRS